LRKAGALQKGDERILGDGEFVEKGLAQAKEAFERKYRLKVKGIHIDRIAARVAEIARKHGDVVALLIYFKSIVFADIGTVLPMRARRILQATIADCETTAFQIFVRP